MQPPDVNLRSAIAAATGPESTPEDLQHLATAAKIAAMGQARHLVGELAYRLDRDGCPDCGSKMTLTYASVRCRACGHRPFESGTLRARALASLLLERIEARR